MNMETTISNNLDEAPSIPALGSISENKYNISYHDREVCGKKTA